MSKRQSDEGCGYRSNNWGRNSEYDRGKVSSFGFKIDQPEDLTVKHGKSIQENWASSQSSVISSARRSYTPMSWSNKSWSWGESACPPPLKSPWSSGSSSPSSDWSGGSGGGGQSWRGGGNGGSGSSKGSSWGRGNQSWRGSGGGGGGGGGTCWGGGKREDDMARFSGMNFGDVMRITVHQEMEKLNMVRKEEPVDLSPIPKTDI